MKGNKLKKVIDLLRRDYTFATTEFPLDSGNNDTDRVYTITEVLNKLLDYDEETK